MFDVLTDVAGLGERRGVGDRERHVEHAGERLRQVFRTPSARGS